MKLLRDANYFSAVQQFLQSKIYDVMSKIWNQLNATQTFVSMYTYLFLLMHFLQY